MNNYLGEELNIAVPGDIVEVTGFKNLPEPSEVLCSTENQNFAKVYEDLMERLEYFLSIQD